MNDITHISLTIEEFQQVATALGSTPQVTAWNMLNAKGREFNREAERMSEELKARMASGEAELVDANGAAAPPTTKKATSAPTKGRG